MTYMIAETIVDTINSIIALVTTYVEVIIFTSFVLSSFNCLILLIILIFHVQLF